ncbi:MAG: hypothetical protein UX62_C0063G0001 [Microgenomates group bacterium GW2011_GWA2_46_7]|nr:MAG: hypothetical protein UX62_C0063G0001 [Microgenomates group bacterium GW2011_GWA2_46_7]KKU45440.1 MAG: hypothetical protein UX64_C0029G0004 [Microgenomates group bacterium GW2011_GWC2_46_7]
MRDLCYNLLMFTPQYQITDQILSWLSDIAEIRGKIAQAKLLPVRETILRRRAIIKMTHSSTSIEGNTLSEAEVEKVAAQQPISATQQDRLEVENYLRALEKVDQLSTKPSITLSHLLTLHRLVMQDLLPSPKTGVLRTSPVFIVNSRLGHPDELVFTPPPASKVKPLVTDLLSWHNTPSVVHPVIRAGILHYQFESIHPFPDGNGRTGRLLTLLSLYQAGWDFRRGLVLEEYYNLDRPAYYQALQAGRDDPTAWLTYFVQGFWVEALRLQESVISLMAGTGTLRGRHLDSSDLKIIDFVLTLGKITSSDVGDILAVPLRTAQSRLARLVKFRILNKYDSGPATHYKLSRVK